MRNFLLLLLLLLSAGCRTPQHRNEDFPPYDAWHNIENSGFDQESKFFLSVLYIVAPR